MKEQKNIDRLFQERFKDFEAEPNDLVWKNIQASLSNKKKERKIVPFWFRFSGIAATFLLGIATLNSVFTTSDENKNGIVLDTNTNVLEKSSDRNNSVLGKDNSRIKINSFDKKSNQNELVITNNNPKTDSNHEKSIKTIVQSKPLDSKKASKNNTNSYFSKNNSSLKQPLASEKPEKQVVASSKKNGINPNPFDASLDEISQNRVRIATKEALANNTNSGKAKNANLSIDPAVSILTKEALANNTNPEKAKKENSATDPAVPNELEELLKKKISEKKQVAEVASKKWQIIPNVAPVFLNSNSKGSPIDEQFSENDKSYENNISLGLGVNYAVTKKLAIRTGINKLAMGFNTNDVSYYAGLNSNSLSGIDYNDKAAGITVVNGSVSTEMNGSEKGIQNTNNGAINQRMGYYEVPLELSYAVLNKKFGISLIGGVSTLFLDENKVSLVGSDSRMDLGKANNLNQVHFSTNIGLGLKYQFLKSFHVNLEPMFKYQINTYSKEAGDFNPFFIGLYSGISYNF